MGHQASIETASRLFREWKGIYSFLTLLPPTCGFSLAQKKLDSPHTENTIPPDLRYAVYSLSSMYGGEREHSFLLNRYFFSSSILPFFSCFGIFHSLCCYKSLKYSRYKSENISAAERRKCLFALAKARDPALVRKNLELSLSVCFF